MSGRVPAVLVVLALVVGVGAVIVMSHHGGSSRAEPSSTSTVTRPSTAVKRPAGALSPQPTATTTTIHTLALRPYAIGDCVTWDQSQRASADTRVVSCASPHLVQITGKVDLASRLHHFPTDADLQRLFHSDCQSDVVTVIGHALDPTSGYVVGGIYPLTDAWAQGERTLWCGIQKPGPSQGTFALVTGKVT